ncbi:Sorbin and SH3 domain-containing protein 2 [Merluccius polli]|uniref:Sorbin and SH3 domain-containing protein 2 n=1 Tax=Merluccius polli TaxID=89951 RepID=A0AA47NXL1_MERPO|nr:Sorbin and SH3 domain-containing protein 2 [Merluccius polli]
MTQGAQDFSKIAIPRAVSPCIMPNSSSTDKYKLIHTARQTNSLKGSSYKSDGSTDHPEHRKCTLSPIKNLRSERAEPISRSRSPHWAHSKPSENIANIKPLVTLPHPDSSRPLDPIDTSSSPEPLQTPAVSPRSTSSVFLALDGALSGIWRYCERRGRRGGNKWRKRRGDLGYLGRVGEARAGEESTGRSELTNGRWNVGVTVSTNSFSNHRTVASYDRQDRREELGISQEHAQGLSSETQPLPDRKSVSETARVLYNFEAHTSKELSLRKGDIVNIMRQIDSNWYEGELRRAVGMFREYVFQAIPSPAVPPRPPSHPAPQYWGRLWSALTSLPTPRSNSLCARWTQNWYEAVSQAAPARYIPLSLTSLRPTASLVGRLL